MKPAMGGYTLLEVMLFLAISTVFLAISNVVLQGQTARTEFTASMNDVNSKMQQWIDEVKTGYSASSARSASAVGNYNCSIDAATNSPRLDFPGAAIAGRGTGSNLACIFLGKAIMINDSVANDPRNINNRIYAYTVLGKRTYDDGTGQVLVNSLKNAKPTAAVFPVGHVSPNINLTDVYQIPNGVRVRHVWSNNPAQSNNLAAFLIDPTSATNSIRAVQYPLARNVDPVAWSTTAWDIPKCINLDLPSQQCQDNAATPDNLWPMTEWNICFESTRNNNDRALLQVISPSGGGAVTKLELGKTSICD